MHVPQYPLKFPCNLRIGRSRLTSYPDVDPRTPLWVSGKPPCTVTIKVPPAPNNACCGGSLADDDDDDDDCTAASALPFPLGSSASAWQSGHVVLERSHASTHSTWNECPQLGSSRTFSPSASSDRHTAQSAPAVAAPSFRYVVTGSAESAEASSPRRPLVAPNELMDRRMPAVKLPRRRRPPDRATSTYSKKRMRVKKMVSAKRRKAAMSRTRPLKL
uniref:Uncharacterized protein n=1 Tax=Triticum urartu TaxID=4572 RepID=A0A8R7PPP0_TRIUA